MLKIPIGDVSNLTRKFLVNLLTRTCSLIEEALRFAPAARKFRHRGCARVLGTITRFPALCLREWTHKGVDRVAKGQAQILEEGRDH